MLLIGGGMADGVTHRRYLNLGWILVIPLSFYISYLFYLGGYNFLLTEIFCLYNYWLCRMLDPDADILQITVGESTGNRLLEKIPLFGGVLRALWMSYTTLYAGIIMMFGGHRSIMSHGLLIGTIGRILYFNLPLFLFLRWIYFKYYEVWVFNNFWYLFFMDKWFIPYYGAQLIFMFIGDGIHLILDLEIAKNVLYTPVEKRRTEEDKLKPKYGKLLTLILKIIFGYSYNKIGKIINFRK